MTKRSSRDASQVSSWDSACATAPKYVLGFNEPDLNSLDAGTGATIWKDNIAPLKAKGSVLGSPAPAVGTGDWLSTFKTDIGSDWDFTAMVIIRIMTILPNLTSRNSTSMLKLLRKSNSKLRISLKGSAKRFGKFYVSNTAFTDDKLTEG
jgi:hypothetical protein